MLSIVSGWGIYIEIYKLFYENWAIRNSFYSTVWLCKSVILQHWIAVWKTHYSYPIIEVKMMYYNLYFRLYIWLKWNWCICILGCPVNTFGARCNECHCKTDCDRETGECKECMEGWHGPNCQMGKRNMIIIHKLYIEMCFGLILRFYV